MMKIASINIAREGYYGYGKTDLSKPFRAQVAVEGENGKVELNLSPELSAKVVAVIADEIVAASKATAEAMTAAVLTAASAAKQLA